MEPIDVLDPGRATIVARERLVPGTAHLRTSTLDDRSIAMLALEAERLTVPVPPPGEVVGTLLWILAPAVPLLAVGGYQAAAIAAAGVLVLRLLNRWSARSTIQFADGFLQFQRDAQPAPGVREDDDVRWRWDRG
jgi:hypothetical protein